MLQFPQGIKQAIGMWEEIPLAAGARKHARATRPMGLHYAADKALQSGLAKRQRRRNKNGTTAGKQQQK